LALKKGRHITPETSVSYYTTRLDIPEDSILRSHRCEKLLSYANLIFLFSFDTFVCLFGIEINSASERKFFAVPWWVAAVALRNATLDNVGVRLATSL
jgi:hypothetical protein